MLTSYITPNEAGEIIVSLKGRDVAQLFIFLPEEEKERLLYGAMLIFERLDFVGGKADPEQVEAFPRIINGRQVGVPGVVKAALALQALEPIYSDTDAASLADNLRASGVSNYSIGDVSIGFNREQSVQIAKRRGLAEDAYWLLKPYIRAGGPVMVR